MGKQLWSTFVTSNWVGLIHVKYSGKRILKRQDKDRVRDRHICPTLIMVLKEKIVLKMRVPGVEFPPKSMCYDMTVRNPEHKDFRGHSMLL